MYKLRSKNLIGIYRYWQTKCQNGRIPARKDINPAEISKLLERLFIVDVERDPWRFKYRIAGTEIYGSTGGDVTGQYLSPESVGANYEDILEPHIDAAISGLPHFGIAAYNNPRGSTGSIIVEAIFLPLATDGKTVNMQLCGQGVVFEGYVSHLMSDGLLREKWTLLQKSRPLTDECVT